MVHPHDLWYDPWTIRPLALARELQALGHRVAICHLPRKEKPSSPPIRRLEPGDPSVYELKPRQVHFIHNFRLLYQLAKDCDIIHLQKCFASTALPVLWVSRLLKKPLHYDWDDNETALAKQVEKRFLSRFQIAVYESMLPHMAHSLTYSSRWIQNRAIQLGFPEEKMFHLPVGADLQRFHPQCEKASALLLQWGLHPQFQTVLYIGQMEGAAHAHLLIEAAPAVIRQFPQTQFLVVGGGEQLEAMRQAALSSPVCEKIFLPGYVEQKIVPSIIASSDICVACFEDDEATRAKSPLKIAEYLASGKAIVASDVGEIPAMTGGCGRIVKAGSPAAIAEGILHYLYDSDQRKQDEKLARHKAEEIFNWTCGSQTLLQAYHTLIS